MDFFEHQDRARRRTGWLILFFVLAVICLIALTDLLVILVMAVLNGGDQMPQSGLSTGSLLNYFSWDVLLLISLGIISVVLIAALYKLGQLRGGGRVVAETLGGRLLPPNTDNADERKILNVVEEMAIASGTPVPPVYLLEEEGINAFAAGYSPADAVIGITQGCIELLDRHELQGVVAHEFSHILNGDMRLNIRLIGILYGILVLGIIGYHLLRTVSRTGYRRRSGKNNGALPLLLLGGGLTVIGYVGTFFGNLIKAAVSRQREFLADASAVQFTRNPEGIGGALKKIGGAVSGSKIAHPSAAQASHLFFGQAVTPLFGGLLATHPPLSDRIQRIDPQWDGRFPVWSAGGAMATPDVGEVTRLVEPAGKNSPETLVAAIGSAEGGDQLQARRILQELSAAVQHAAHEPYGARALIYALLIDRSPEVAQRQWRQLQQSADPEVYQLTRELAQEPVRKPELRISILDLCLPALRQLSPCQFQVFKSNLASLMKADNKIDLHEWALYRIVLHYLEPRPMSPLNFGRVRSLKGVAKAVGLVLSAVATAGADTGELRQAGFDAGKIAAGLPRLTYIRPDEYQLRDLSQALAVLNRLAPLQKPRLLKALAKTVAIDNQIRPLEAELIRAIAAALDCPAPPL